MSALESVLTPFSVAVGITLILFVLVAGLNFFPATANWMFRSTRRLPPGEARQRLEELTLRAGVALREILVQKDHPLDGPWGGWLFGLTARTRLTLLSHSATQQPERAEAILAHELGHARCGHPALRVVSLATYLVSFLCVVLAAQTFGRWSLLAAMGLFLFLSMPFTSAVRRRFELEADLFAADLVGGASYISILEAAQATWPRSPLPAWLRGHPSVEQRTEHILACQGSEENRERFERSCRLARSTIAASCAVAAMALTTLLAMGV